MKKNFDLSNIKNYNKKFKKDLNFYTKEYLLLMKEIIDYLDKYIETGNNKKLYIVLKGIESINHIFLLLLLYTKNLSLTLYHCKKSFLYYIEFISQIGEEGNSYLQLNSKDAILFIYKKSIFDINNDIRQNHELSEEDEMKLSDLKKLTETFKDFYILFVNNIIDGSEYQETYIESIIRIMDTINKKKSIDNDIFEKIYVVIYYLNVYKVSNNNIIINICKSLLRRKKFLQIKITDIKKKIKYEKVKIYINTNNIKGLINFLLSKP